MVWRSWIRKPLLFAVAACLLTGGESAPYNPTYGYASAVAVKGIADDDHYSYLCVSAFPSVCGTRIH